MHSTFKILVSGLTIAGVVFGAVNQATAKARWVSIGTNRSVELQIDTNSIYASGNALHVSWRELISGSLYRSGETYVLCGSQKMLVDGQYVDPPSDLQRRMIQAVCDG